MANSFNAVIWAAGMIVLSVSGCRQSHPNLVVDESARQDHFKWLDSTSDSQAWNEVKVAFRQELEPDDPRKVPSHYVATQYKYIHQIGIFKTAALVIIGYKETKESPGDEYFNAYSYDLRDGLKRPIVAEPPGPPGTYPFSDVLWLFKVTGFAQFDKSPTPDVVFTYDSCTECEAEHLLASFEYDPPKGWSARQWDKSYSVYLEGDPDPGGDVVSTDYLFKIKDWNRDGFDDLAVRRREITRGASDRQKTDDFTTVYTAEHGILVGHAIRDAEQLDGINTELCNDSKLSFCFHRN